MWPFKKSCCCKFKRLPGLHYTGYCTIDWGLKVVPEYFDIHECVKCGKVKMEKWILYADDFEVDEYNLPLMPDQSRMKVREHNPTQQP